MNRKKMIKATLIVGLFFLGLGGWLLHYRIHPPSKGAVYLIPYVIGVISVFFLPILFSSRKTITAAYLINGFFVILGTIFMGHFSVVHFEGPLTLLRIITNTLFMDILLLWGKFAVGKALFDLELLKTDTDNVVKGRFFRYPNMGWWWVHLFALTAVYAAGNIIGK